MSLQVECTKYRFRALDTLVFPQGTAGNRLRGALGRILKTRYPEHYESIFAPHGTGPSGFADTPRPFVLRVSNLDGKTFVAGSEFDVEANIFDAGTLPVFQNAITELGREGLGELLTTQIRHLHVSLLPDPEPLTRLRVDFLTPTELKCDGVIVPKPDFPVLFRRIRDRVSTLCALYGAGPLDIDFQGLALRAEQVGMTSCKVRKVRAERRSGSTGQVHSLGGFVGEAEYEGELQEFVPYLEAAQWTGVGRQTVWGKGEIVVTRLP